jgi:glycosyltransferase involved in cell wall biosynthesis
MAASLPLVGTNIGGIPVILKDGTNGYLCESENPIDLAQKIDKLLDSDFKIMGNKSKEMVDKYFDWNEIASKTLDEYKGIV